MMTAVETWLQKGRRMLKGWAADPRLRRAAEVAAYGGSGFLMSAVSLANAPQPLAMGLISACGGWQAAVTALGSMLGYRVFWGGAGSQGMVWAALGCLLALTLGRRKETEETPVLVPAVAAFLVSFTGLVFQIAFGDETSVPVYLLRTVMAAASAGLFGVVMRRREQIADWLAVGAAVLALAQVAPAPWLGLGFIAGGMLAAGASVPAAVLAGLALDLAQVCDTPMTAVMALSCLVRTIPAPGRWLRCAGPAAVCCGVAALCGTWELAPILGLAVGGGLAAFLPPRPNMTHRRGETGMAQVRLELMAGVLLETQQILLEERSAPIDREALLLRTQERACGGCPNRKQCRDIRLPEDMLDRPVTDTAALGIPCKKPGRMVLELRRSQEQLRNLRADRDRRREYRQAAAQQYCFLGEYLREQADQLPRRGYAPRQRFTVEAEIRSAGKELANGDKCVKFTGPECRYYILLCDGMGTGLGAAQEGQEAAALLRQMLSAGFPAEYALRSLNSLLTLRGRAGAVTVDLAEIKLDTGRVAIYKWGAAPSYLLRAAGAEKIGTAGPPPGLSVDEGRETVERLSLRRGEALILFSDGVDPGRAMHREGVSPQVPPGELAALLLEQAGEDRSDDATVAVIRLSPATLST